MELKDCFSTEDLRIGKDDIINIATSQYEEGLELEIEQGNIALNTKRSEIRETEEDMKSEMDSLLSSKTAYNVKTVISSLKKISVTYSPQVKRIKDSGDSDTVSFMVT